MGSLCAAASHTSQMESLCAAASEKHGEITTKVCGCSGFGPFGSGGTIIGSTASGWERARVAFEENFAKNRELGAQLVVYHGDSKVVDLVGYSSQQPGYTPETLQCVFSSGKNMEAVAMAMLVDRGLVKYNDTVATHWREFGMHGKQDVTIADVMRHESGLSYFSKPGDPKTSVVVTKAMVKDIDTLEDTIANSGLNCPPGERHYHAFTRGWIVSAVLRRVDPKKRTLGKFMQDEICGPLGITYFCGIPEPEQANYKLADLIRQPPNCYTKCFEEWPKKLGCVKADPLPKPDSHWLVPTTEWSIFTENWNNTPEGRAAEISSAGLYTNARSMAKVNACMANGGKLGNVRIMSEKACADSMAFSISKFDPEIFGSVPFSQGGFGDWGRAEFPAGDPTWIIVQNGFVGWHGYGGSMSIWNPEKHVAVSYVPNGMLNAGVRGTDLMCALSSIISQ